MDRKIQKTDNSAGTRTNETVRFVADARLLSILGEQLIGSEKVGVLELVKNAYDAGASACTVTIEAVPDLEPQTRTLKECTDLPGPVIEIRDNGSGMSHDAIVNGWLRPATSIRGRVKDQLKRERAAAVERGSLESYEALTEALRREHGGRLPLGEKGIGRLATHRLGENLWLRTKTAEDPLEWELRIAWNKFDTNGAAAVDLSKIELTLVHQPPSTEYPTGSGTVLVCYGGREGYTWNEASLAELGEDLMSLQSPRAEAGFSVSFITPHVALDRFTDRLQYEAPFELVAIVDEDGAADIDLTFTPPGHLDRAPEPFRRTARVDLRAMDLDYWRKPLKEQVNGESANAELSKDAAGDEFRRPVCGPFLIHALCWFRLPKWLGPEYRKISSHLDRFGGLAIYRDGILAQPSQQAARSDWLGLASRQIKKASKLSYYQLIGEIEIEQSKTLALRDRSSREGMIETRAFDDLTELTKAVLRELETDTRKTRDEWLRKEKVRKLSLASATGAAKAAAKLFETLAESYDFDRDELSLRKVSSALRSRRRSSTIADALKELPAFLTARDEERDGLMDAAGFGLATAVSIHEIAHMASSIAADCRAIVRNPESGSLRERLRQVGKRSEALLAEVRRLAPLRTTRSESPQIVSVKKAIEASRDAFATSLEDASIQIRIHGGDFSVSARFGALAQVFANLLDNSIYWLMTSQDKREIRIELDGVHRTVLIADSGPGVSEKMRPVLFEPFYSEKANPSGLGLYVCRHYLSQMRGAIRLARPAERCELPGAQFVLDFGKPKETSR